MSEQKHPLIPAYMEACVKERTLELLAFGQETCCSKELIDLSNLSAGGFTQMFKANIAESWARDIVRMVAKWYCPAELKREIRYPENWLEAIKERFAPKWLLQRWPVRYVVHKIYDMYPEIEWPKQRGHRLSMAEFVSHEPGDYFGR